MDFEFDIYKDEYHDQVIHVLKSELWALRSIDDCRQLFQWKYLNNPFTKTAAGCVALYQGRVVSFFGLFIQEYRLNDKKFLCAVRSDASTLPEFQGKGIFRKLTRFSLDYFFNKTTPRVDFVLALSSNEASSAVYKKSGWQEMGIKQMRYRISMRGITKYIARNYPKHLINKEVQVGNLTAVIDGAGIDYSAVKHLVPTIRDRMHRNITEPYWNWRYKHPLQKNGFCCVKTNQEVKAFIICQRISHNRFVLTDYFFNDEDALHFGLKTFMQTQSIADLQCWVLGKRDDERLILKRLGFKNLESITRHVKRLRVPPALIRPCQPEISDSSWQMDSLDVRLASNWYLNPCDSDIF